MIQVIASIACSKCKRAKIKLDKAGIKYSYRLIDELNPDTAERYRNKAIDAGQQSFPIILKDDELVKLEEVLDE